MAYRRGTDEPVGKGVCRIALEQWLAKAPGSFMKEETVQALCGFAAQRRKQIESDCAPLGARLFAEKPKHFAKRIEAYWNATGATP